MKKRPPQNIDGFIPRRRNSSQVDGQRLGLDSLPVPDRFLDKPPEISAHPQRTRQIGETAIDEANLDGINPSFDAEPPKKKKRFQRPDWLTYKRMLIGLAVLAALIFGYLGVRFIIASMSVFDGNLLDVFSSKSLKKDEFGRTNIVLFGTSEDSRAHQENGAGSDLTDSIQVISVDQETKDAVMFSVPRDLWVSYGESCVSGFEGKINVVYECGKENGGEKAGAKKLMDIIGQNFDLEMHYYAKVNYSAVEDAVNAVGGVTVTIDSDDPRGIFDPNFDWQCNYTCNLVKYENGPAKLNGKEALALARARNAAGGYGLGGGNFDREANQQKIMLAIKDKATSAGTLTNPVKLSGLVDTLGNNVRTNFATGEIRTLAGLGNDIKPASIKRLSLVDVKNPVMTTGNINGQSIVQPVAGISDFSEVQRYVRSALTKDASNTEEAAITVLNASDTPGVAAKYQRELSTKRVIVSEIGDAPTGVTSQPIEWYDLTGGEKPKTAEKIKKALGVSSSGNSLPAGVQADADFVILVGNGAT